MNACDCLTVWQQVEGAALGCGIGIVILAAIAWWRR